MNDLDTIDALEQVQDSEQIQQIAVSEIRQTHINLVKSSMKRLGGISRIDSSKWSLPTNYRS